MESQYESLLIWACLEYIQRKLSQVSSKLIKCKHAAVSGCFFLRQFFNSFINVVKMNGKGGYGTTDKQNVEKSRSVSKKA